MATAFLKHDPRKSRKSTKSAGKTAVAHTRAWIGEIHPGAKVLEASKKVGRFPGGKTVGGETIWINRTIEEDIFGVFDLCVFSRAVFVDLVQCTTIGRDLSAVRARQSKVANWIRNNYGKPPLWLGNIYVVGWVPRKHLRIWRWSWEQMDAHTFGGWQEQEPAEAKLPKKTRTSLAIAQSSDPSPQIPF